MADFCYIVVNIPENPKDFSTEIMVFTKEGEGLLIFTTEDKAKKIIEKSGKKLKTEQKTFSELAGVYGPARQYAIIDYDGTPDSGKKINLTI